MRRIETGRRGEELAADHLVRKGWTVLDRNLRVGRREVDLVVARPGVVAFVEVKARRGEGYGHPGEAITLKKQAEVARVARAWLHSEEGGRALRTFRGERGVLLRYDAVGIVIDRDTVRVEHLEDAWGL